MEAPADVEYDTVSEWRRSPAQPVTVLIGSTNPSLPPARPKSTESDTEAFVRRRSGHGKAVAAVVAYLRVSGPLGPLTGVYSTPPATPLTATQNPSYNIHH